MKGAGLEGGAAKRGAFAVRLLDKSRAVVSLYSPELACSARRRAVFGAVRVGFEVGPW